MTPTAEQLHATLLELFAPDQGTNMKKATAIPNDYTEADDRLSCFTCGAQPPTIYSIISDPRRAGALAFRCEAHLPSDMEA